LLGVFQSGKGSQGTSQVRFQSKLCDPSPGRLEIAVLQIVFEVSERRRTTLKVWFSVNSAADINGTNSKLRSQCMDRRVNSGVPTQPFDNVDLYSLMAEILNIKPAKTDGSICAALLDLETRRRVVPLPRSQP
jgi:hypothetical protein